MGDKSSLLSATTVPPLSKDRDQRMAFFDVPECSTCQDALQL